MALIPTGAASSHNGSGVESAMRLENLIQASPMGIHMYRLDERGRLIFAGYNRAANRLLGVDHAQFIGMTIEEAFPPLSQTEVPERYVRAALLGESWATDQFFYADDRVGGVFSINAFQIAPGEMGAMFFDITRQKEAEFDLRTSEASLRALVKAIPDLRLICSRDGTFVNCVAPFGTEQLYLPPEVFIGKRIEEVMPPELAKTAMEKIEAVYETNTLQSFEYTLPIGGQISSFEARIVRIDEDLVLILTRDITDRILLQAERRRAHQELERRVEERTAELERAHVELKNITAQLIQSAKMSALGELTAGIAHELNQPLNAVKITCQSIVMDIKKNRIVVASLPEMLNGIVHQVNKLAGIIQHMRIFTRQTCGSTYDVVEINAAVEGAFRFVEQQLADNGIKVTKNLPPQPAYVYGDEVGIEQVILNLLSNARHALIESQREDKLLVVRVEEDSSEVRIAIRDNGTGIADEIKPKLFTPFVTTKQQGEGTGLGLSVSGKIIQEHGGRISFDSVLGEYTEFVIRLPNRRDAVSGNKS